jgi:hypothetical protein
MEDILEIIEFSNWPALVKELENNSDESKIYRGHSNNYSYERVKIQNRYNRKVFLDYWKLISSFNRHYSTFGYLFRTYLKQQFADGFFKSVYGEYSFKEIDFLKECSLIERVYYFQHYGVPTCLIDFTKDPLIALYFAISSVKASNGGALDKDDNPYYHPSEPFISIFEVNFERITDLLKVKFIDKDSLIKIYDDYDMYGCHIAFDINPLHNCQTQSVNENLTRQKGCFILFDNNNTDLTLVNYLKSSLKSLGIRFEILVREYRLPYNKVFHKGGLDEFKDIKLFTFLNKHNATGRTLFNDIQGLRHDLNFFHNS